MSDVSGNIQFSHVGDMPFKQSGTVRSLFGKGKHYCDDDCYDPRTAIIPLCDELLENSVLDSEIRVG